MSYFPAIVCSLLLASATPPSPTSTLDAAPGSVPDSSSYGGPAKTVDDEVPEVDPLAEFDKALEKVTRFSSQGKWKKAKAALLKAAEAHVDTPGILTRVGDIRDRLRACSFWLQYERPEPKDVVSGRLKSYNASNGKIELRYEWPRGQTIDDDPMDFIPLDWGDKAAWRHPAPFAGPYTLEVRGKAPGAQPGLFACMDYRGGLIVVSYDSVEVSGMFRIGDDEEEEAELIAKSAHGFDSGAKYEFAIKVSKRRVRATIEGRNELDGERAKDDPWGFCGLRNFKGVRDITVRGVVETSWIEGLIDQEVQIAREAFRAGYDATADLPDKLQAVLRERHEMPEDLGVVYPGMRKPSLSKATHQIWKFINQDDLDAAKLHLDGLGDKTPEPYQRWMSAFTDWFGGDLEQAVEHCDWVVENAPEFYWGHHLRSLFRVSRESAKTQLADAEALVALFPKRAEAYDRLAWVLANQRKLDEAMAVLDRAVLAGCSPDGLETRRVTLLRAQSGPHWDRPDEWKSRHFIVRSDMAEARCFDASNILEDARARWNSHLRRAPKKSKANRAQVFLFAGEAGYKAYIEELIETDPEHTLGVYVPSVGQLMLWSGTDREEWEHTIRHEGFHQYLDQLAPTAPTWFHEGMAEYYATDDKLRGRWIAGYVYPHYLSTLRQRELVPLARFLRFDSRAFMQDPAAHYAQAWAFIHFLLHGKDRKSKKRFNAYLDELIDGEGAEAALDKAFKGVSFPDLDTKFKQYVQSLKVR